MMIGTPKNTQDIRCGNCNRLLARGSMDAGEIELVCPRCKTRVILRAMCPNPAPQDGLLGDRHVRVSASLPEKE